jgi:hypothetical protein
MLMKRLFFSIIFIIIGVITFAQKSSEYNSQNTERPIKRYVFVDIIDKFGKSYNGYLWFADSSNIVLAKSLNTDTIICIESEDIYSIRFKQKDKFGKRFLHHFIITTTAAGIGTLVSYSTGEAIMVGAGFIFGVLTIYGTPVALLTALIPYKRTRHYNIDSNQKEFLDAYPFMKRKRISNQFDVQKFKAETNEESKL